MTTKTFAVTAPDYSTTFGEDCKDSGHQFRFSCGNYFECGDQKRPVAIGQRMAIP